MMLPVNEIFESIQGEGSHSGRPSVFLRLQGCDVGCPWCLSPDARFLTGDFQTVSAGDVKPGMSMIGTARNVLGAVGRYSRGVVIDAVHQMADRVRVIFEDRSDAVVSVGHRFVLGLGGRFRRVESLKPGDMIRSYDSGAGQLFTAKYKLGYLAGAADGDGSFHDKSPTTSGAVPFHFVIACKDEPLLARFRQFASDLGFQLNWGLHTSGGQFAPTTRIPALRLTRTEQAKAFRDALWRDHASRDWMAGYLAGMYDTDGSTDGNTMRWSQTKERTRHRLLKVMRSYGLCPIEDGQNNIRINGGAMVQRPLLAAMRPAVERKVDPLWFQEHRHSGYATVSRVEPIGRGEIVSIMTSLGTYVADGLPARNCDTKHTWTFASAEEFNLTTILAKRSDSAMYAKVDQAQLGRFLTGAAYSARHVVITGGEPATHDLRYLSGLLLDSGRSVQLETSGTEPILIDDRAFVTLSPKIDMPGARVVRADAARRADEIKMPVGKPTDIAKLKAFLVEHEFDSETPVWLQPISASDKATALCITEAIANNWRLSVQIHRVLGVR